MAEDQLLTRALLTSPASTEALGTIARARLWEDGAVIFFLNRADQVETAPLREVQLDGLPEERAVQALLAKGYDDDALVSYLRARDARLHLADQ